MVASPLAATVVTAILRCDFCAAKAPDDWMLHLEHQARQRQEMAWGREGGGSSWERGSSFLYSAWGSKSRGWATPNVLTAGLWWLALSLRTCQKNSRRLELSISKNTPHGRSAEGPGQCGPNVCDRFAFPGARNPRICSISRSGKNFPAIFPALSWSFPRESPNRPRKQPQPSRVF